MIMFWYLYEWELMAGSLLLLFKWVILNLVCTLESLWELRTKQKILKIRPHPKSVYSEYGIEVLWMSDFFFFFNKSSPDYPHVLVGLRMYSSSSQTLLHVASFKLFWSLAFAPKHSDLIGMRCGLYFMIFLKKAS